MAGWGNFGEILNVLDESKKIYFYLGDKSKQNALNLEDVRRHTYFTVEYVYSSSLYDNALSR
jgi:hypothetical protein